MSSRTLLCVTLSLALGCASFRRGETWDADTDGDPSETSAAAPGSSGPAPSEETGDGETTAAPGSSGDVPATGSETSTGTATGPSFHDDVLPLLRAGCERCHTAEGAASTTSFLLDVDDDTAYETTLQFVDVDTPSASRLLAKTAGQGHTGGVIYDDRSAEYDAILAWIEHGALP